jgi:5S rRNA maturation endonuclease (ribonuclease M5)
MDYRVYTSKAIFMPGKNFTKLSNFFSPTLISCNKRSLQLLNLPDKLKNINLATGIIIFTDIG